MLHIILHQSLSYPKIGRPLISHYFDKRDLQRISRTKQHISQVTLPALQRISQEKTTYFSGNVTSPATYFSGKTTYFSGNVTSPYANSSVMGLIAHNAAISPIALLSVLLVPECCY